jgi:hypothetical protein
LQHLTGLEYRDLTRVPGYSGNSNGTFAHFKGSITRPHIFRIYPCVCVLAFWLVFVCICIVTLLFYKLLLLLFFSLIIIIFIIIIVIIITVIIIMLFEYYYSYNCYY